MVYEFNYMIYLIIIFAIFFSVLSFLRKDWAFFVLLFSLPAYQIRFSVFGVPSTLLELMILVFAFVWCWENYQIVFKGVRLRFKNFTQKNLDYKVYDYPLAIELIIILLISWLAMMIAGFSNSALGIWKAYFFEPILLYVLAFNVFYRTKNFSFFVWPFVYSSFLIALFTFFQKFTGLVVVENFLPRLSSIYPYPNALGLFLGPFVFLILGFLLSEKKLSLFQKFFVFSSFALSLSAIFLARSEGALVGIIVAFLFCFFYFLFYKYKIGKYFLGFFVFSVVLFSCFAPCFYAKILPKHSYYDFGNDVLNKVYDKIVLNDFSGEVRKQQWRETFALLEKDNNWLWGVGLGNYKKEVAIFHQDGIFFNKNRDIDFQRKIIIYNEKYKAEHWRPVEIYLYPHNLFLNFWVELGIFGALLFVLVIVRFFVFAFRVLFSEEKTDFFVLGLLCSMLVLVVHGMVDVPYFKNDLSCLFWIVISFLFFPSVIPGERSLSLLSFPANEVREGNLGGRSKNIILKK